MTMTYLDEIEALLGPNARRLPFRFVHNVEYNRVLIDGNGYLFGRIDQDDYGQLIASTITNLPTLLAAARENERLRAENAELREALTLLRDEAADPARGPFRPSFTIVGIVEELLLTTPEGSSK